MFPTNWVWFEYFEEQIIEIGRVAKSLPINLLFVVDLEDAETSDFPSKSKEFEVAKKYQKSYSFTTIKANSFEGITIVIKPFASTVIVAVIAFTAESVKIVTVTVGVIAIILIVTDSVEVTVYLQQWHFIA